MAKYRITGPDGGTFEIEAPDTATPDQVLAYAKQNMPPAAPASGARAPSSGVAMGLRDPVDAGAQILRRIVPEPIARGVDAFGNWLADKGLPVARSEGVQGVDQIVKDVNRSYDQQRGPDAGFDWARLGGNVLNPVSYAGGGALGTAKGAMELARAGGIAGAVSGVMQPVTGNTDNFLASKIEQAGAGALGGAVATPIVSKVVNAAGQGAQRLMARPQAQIAQNPQQVQIIVNNAVQSQGMNLADAPPVILQSVERQVRDALQAGQRLDPAAIVRRAQFEAVGLTGDAGPTVGQLTRDPMQFANEKNLSGVQLSRGARGMGNDLADRFNTQQQRLGEVFDQAGATQATDRVTAGQTLIDALRETDVPVKSAVDGAYQNARSMTAGRAAEIDSGAFSQAANDALDRGMWGHFVPPEIRSLLNDVTTGKTPLTVETSVQLDSILSSAQRRAGQGSPQASAIGVIRDALHSSPLRGAQPGVASPVPSAAAEAARTVDEGVTDVAARMVRPDALPGQRALPAAPGTAIAPDFEIPLPRQGTAVGPAIPPQAPPIDEGAAAREAFDQARRAARNRFATIEDTPALAAALDGVAPDKFVQRYVLNADTRDVEAMRRVLSNSPEALAQARAQVADFLKRAAFGENPSGDKAFTSDRYLRTVRAIGRQKLEAFFSPAEIMRLNLAGKVASDINSIPAGAKYGTNTSGTGAAVMNLLSQLGGKALDKIPVVGQVAGLIADQAGAMRTQRQISQALSPEAAQAVREAPPEVMRALQLLFPPGSVAGGVLGGSAAQ